MFEGSVTTVTPLIAFMLGGHIAFFEFQLLFGAALQRKNCAPYKILINF